jgi:hypothetical protein
VGGGGAAGEDGLSGRGDRGRRLFSWLLRLYPRGFRELRGAGMERLFDDMRGEGATRSGAVFWARLVWDMVRGAALEWWALVARRRHGMDRRRRSGAMLTELSDLRYAIRQLVREPAYSATVVVLMALGIGGNVAVFRVLNGLFVRPLPFDHPEQLVDLDETAPQWNLDYVSVASADFVRWRSDNRTFQSMAAFSTGGLNLSGGGAAERVDYLASTHDLDDVLGIVPQLGRFYRPQAAIPSAIANSDRPATIDWLWRTAQPRRYVDHDPLDEPRLASGIPCSCMRESEEPRSDRPDAASRYVYVPHAPVCVSWLYRPGR